MSRSAQAATPWRVELLGASYRTAPLEVLGRLALSPEEIQGLYERAREIPGLANLLVLSTCNRTELYGLATSEQPLGDALRATLADVVGAARLPAEEHFYRTQGRDSVLHLFRVAAGLDSMILGEAQILGQLREAFEASCSTLAPTPAFDRLLHAAFAGAKRSRGETEIGKGAVSVASAAVHLATRIFADMSKSTVVIIGAGETGRLVLEHFQAHQPRRFIVVNRTFERAEALARSVDGLALPWEKLGEAVAQADVVACAVRAATPVLDRALVASALGHHANRVVALLDLGLPRNIAGDVGGLGNVFVSDLDAFRQVVDANLGRRKKEVPRVEAIIEEEIDRLLDWHRTAEVGPLIAMLRDSVESIRRAEVEKATSGLSPAERAAVERATRAVVNKLLHGPTASIKELARDVESAERLEVVSEFVASIGRTGGVS